MFLVSVLRNALFILLPLSLICTSYLYSYPLFQTSCSFPTPEHDATTAYFDTLRQHVPFSPKSTHKVAPFRLLSLGDPQLEGDTSIPDPDAASFPNFWKFLRDSQILPGIRRSPLQRLRHSLHDLVDFYLDDIPNAFAVYRKRLDHIGNDYYLGHIYRTLDWWAIPTHVTVLGDLIGSQWIDNEEFEIRGWRFWNRVFKGAEKVPDELASAPSHEFNQTMVLGGDKVNWKRRIINVAGNHDIGYAGDLSEPRIERFTRVFGKPNYELRFQLPGRDSVIRHEAENQKETEEEEPTPELRIIVLNDMNLDTPAGSQELQSETYDFLNEVISTSKDVARPAHFTLVLTHIPLYKEAGICIDGPFFDFFQGEFSDGVKEQNHLSIDASKGFLEGIFGMSGNPSAAGHGFGRNGLILNGHDHEGCDIYHYINQTSEESERPWQAKRWTDALISNITEDPGIPGLREITVRSMMGDFAGSAGLLSVWFDEETWDWKFEFSNCRLGRQHFWWFVHVLDIVTLSVVVIYAVVVFVSKLVDAVIRACSAKSLPRSSGVLMKRSAKENALTMLEGTIFEVPKLAANSNGSGATKRSVRKRRSKLRLQVNGSADENGH